MIVSAQPHNLRSRATLHRHDPHFHPRFELCSQLFSDILLLPDNSPLVMEQRWISESHRSVRRAVNETEGSILAVHLVNHLDTPMNPGCLSLAKFRDRPLVLVSIGHWRPGDWIVHRDWTYEVVSRMNGRGIRRMGRRLTTRCTSWPNVCLPSNANIVNIHWDSRCITVFDIALLAIHLVYIRSCSQLGIPGGSEGIVATEA
jgi:hypothetical protein